MFNKKKLNNEHGAIDLASIMVGVVVIGIISGIIASTVFVVIPWAQDEAAKQQLSNVKTAQEGYISMEAAGLTSSYVVSGSVTADENSQSYGSMKQLVDDGLISLKVDPTKDGFTADGVMCTNATLDGYEAAIKSVTGNVFKTANGSKITKSAPGETTCLGVTQDPNNPVDPGTPTLLDATMAFSYNCPVSAVPVVPVNSFNGTATWNVNGVETVINAASVTDVLSVGPVPADVPVTLRLEGAFGDSVSMPYGYTADKNCLRSVDEWTAPTVNASYAFQQAANLISIATPPESITNASHMFSLATSFNGSLGSWTASNVTNMERMFGSAHSFNQSVSNFDTSNVTNMYYMFDDAYAFNQSVSNFDTSNVTNMHGMFSSALSFNQPVNAFNTSNVTDMGFMFGGAQSFNQSVSNFDTSKVTVMVGMFSGAFVFNQPLNTFDTSKVTNMIEMFKTSLAFNQPVSTFDTSNVTNMSGMFDEASSFNQSVSNFDTSNVTEMRNMFNRASAFNQPLNDWDVSNVTDMVGMFINASAFNQPLNDWDVDSVTMMNYMFTGAGSFNQDISGWDVTNVTTWTGFRSASPLTASNTPSKFL